MKILGIHEGHNASACLLEDGRIKYCIQEERLTNSKNFWGFPEKSILKICELDEISVSDIDYIALAAKHMAKPSNVLEDYQAQKKSVKSIMIEVAMKTPVYKQYRKMVRKERINRVKKLGAKEDKILFVDHHLCHASMGYYSAPFKKEEVLVLTCDGSGDGLCATVSTGKDGDLKRIAETRKGHSIGNIYSQVTFMLGLVPWEHEWKIMGMAPYASEKDAKKSEAVFKKYLTLDEEKLVFRRMIKEPTYLIYKRLRKDLELHRFDWISAGVQNMTEDLLCQWVKACIKKTGLKKLVLSGGVFMNVKANKRILEIDEVEGIFVAPSCGDESNSIGAAYRVYAEKRLSENKNVDIPDLGPIYLGPEFSDADIDRAMEKRPSFKMQTFDDIDQKAAELLANGKIIARCSNGMEFGARALGNRSILADPSNPDCVRIINMMIKKRDFWMPFAPVMLKERMNEYIINPKKAMSPYMMLSFDTTEKRLEFMAGVHQADLTARAQIIEENYNPSYHRILKEFEKITGRAILLNTSFNLHGYPMVYGPDEALWVFENSGLEYLVMNNHLITKQ